MLLLHELVFYAVMVPCNLSSQKGICLIRTWSYHPLIIDTNSSPPLFDELIYWREAVGQRESLSQLLYIIFSPLLRSNCSH